MTAGQRGFCSVCAASHLLGKLRRVENSQRFLLDGCECGFGVFEFGVPGGAAALGGEVEDDVPERVGVGGSAAVLSGVGHVVVHLAGPEVIDGSVAAGEDVERGDVAVFGADVGAGVVAFGVGVDGQVAPAAVFAIVDYAADGGARGDGEGDALAGVARGAV